jgi:hypothetical protein
MAASLKTVLAALLLSAGASAASSQTSHPHGAEWSRLIEALHLSEADLANGKFSYNVARADLNGDGFAETIYLLEGDLCGMGGCTTLILGRDAILADIPVTRPPVCVFSDQKNGYRDIEVGIQGGGDLTYRRNRLRFNGSTYEYVSMRTYRSPPVHKVSRGCQPLKFTSN